MTHYRSETRILEDLKWWMAFRFCHGRRGARRCVVAKGSGVMGCWRGYSVQLEVWEQVGMAPPLQVVNGGTQ